MLTPFLKHFNISLLLLLHEWEDLLQVLFQLLLSDSLWVKTLLQLLNAVKIIKETPLTSVLLLHEELVWFILEEPVLILVNILPNHWRFDLIPPDLLIHLLDPLLCSASLILQIFHLPLEGINLCLQNLPSILQYFCLCPGCEWDLNINLIDL